MNFALSEEQQLIRETIHNFVVRECSRDSVKKMDENREYPAGLFSTIQTMGFCGLIVPEEFGGGGPDTMGAVLVVEELAALYPSLAAIFIASTFCGGNIISSLGSQDQKKRLLPEIVDKASLFAYALRESDDAYGQFSARTRAVASGNGFVLSGTKVGVRLADRADYYLVLANTDPEKDPEQGLTVFIVDSKKKGITVRPTDKVGFDSITIGAVEFNNVALDASDVLGGPEMINRGWPQLQRIMESENLEVAGVALGMAQGAYEYATRYAKDRVQFGKPIIDFGAVRHMLADMAIQIKGARLIAYQAAWLNDKGENPAIESVMARYHAVGAASAAALNCVQVLGGYGYAREYDAQRYLRDAVVMLTGGESVEVIKENIAKSLALEA